MKAIRICLIAIFCITSSDLFAQQLVFGFTNPSFGGNPLNASWLLQSAQAQSDYQQRNDNANGSNATSLEDFATNLNNQILYSLANAIIQKQFGNTDKLKEGLYNVGQFRINIGSGSNGLIVTIFDNSTGNQTQITIPNY